MRSFFAPLLVFAGGNLLLLVATLVMPAIDIVQTQLAADTAAVAATFWGWSWLMTGGVVRWLVYLLIEGLTLLATFKTFMATRNT